MSRIFCVGRNYQEHAKELGNIAPDSPIIFIKPISSLASHNKIHYPQHGNVLHYETELVIKIGKAGKPKKKSEIAQYISGFGIGLDLTLRDLQAQLKAKGYPWEIAKAFDDSATISHIIPYQSDIHQLNNYDFKCHINGIEKQNGNSKDMIFNIETIILFIASIWKLEVNDLIYTGTPKGVGEIHKGDTISISGDLIPEASWQVI